MTEVPPDARPAARSERVPEVRIDAVSPKSPAAAWTLARYFEELARRFEEGFDPAKSVVPDASELAPPDGVFLVVSVDGRWVGCGGVKRVDPQTGYIKRMWIDGSMRGLGLGRRLLEALERAAVDLGCSVAQLETNRALKEAVRLYRRSGYEEVAPFNDEPYAHHWFERRLIEPEAQSR